MTNEPFLSIPKKKKPPMGTKPHKGLFRKYYL